MSRDDWFRNEEWTAEIETAFEAKLSRARDKAQYLLLQAGHLTGSHPEVALALIDRYFAAGGNLSLASAHEIRAHANLSLGQLSEAISAFEAALSREKEFPNWRTRAAFDLAKLIVDCEMTERYYRAQELLDELRYRLTFPADRYIWAGTAAVISAWQGHLDEGRALAREALSAATATHSGFRYHPDVGLVRSADDDFRARLTALANGHAERGKPRRKGWWRLLS